MCDFWPLNNRSDKKVIVDVFKCLFIANTLTLLLLIFNVVYNLILFDPWPLNHWSDKNVTVDVFERLSKATTLTLLLLSFDVVGHLTCFDLLTMGHTKRSLWTFLNVCPWLTHWHYYFWHLMLFTIWTYLTSVSLNMGPTKMSPWPFLISDLRQFSPVMVEWQIWLDSM